MKWNTRGTTLFKAFLLNAFAAALIATVIIETRFALDPATRPITDALPEAFQTFTIGFMITFVIYTAMYLALGYGSSLSATKVQPPYW